MGEVRGVGVVSLGAVFIVLLAQKGVLAIHATAFCVQLGQSGSGFEGIVTVLFYYTQPNRDGYYTIGGKLNDLKYRFLDMCMGTDQGKKEIMSDSVKYESCENYELAWWSNKDMERFVNFCPLEFVEINTYAVEQDGKVMYGWLHVEIKLKYSSDDILGIYVQMRDEFFNAVGEFMTKEDEQCSPVSSEAAAQPSKYQVLPCAAVGFREAKVSHAIVMAPKDGYVRPGDLPSDFFTKEELKAGIHFTWRMSEYWCNRHYMIRPEALILTRQMVYDASGMEKRTLTGTSTVQPPGPGAGIETKDNNPYRRAADYWIRPRWYGAADIKLPHTTLKCDKKVIDYDNGKMTGVAPWLYDYSNKSIVVNDYIWNENVYIVNCSSRIPGKCRVPPQQTFRSCQQDTWKEFGNASYYIPTFSGRCTHHLKKNPTHQAFQGCNLNANSPEFADLPPMDTYKDYTEKLNANRTSLCATKCQLPETPEEITAFKETPRGNATRHSIISAEKRSVQSRRVSKGIRLFQGHKFHAAVGVVWSVFFTPISIFASRYYKETCMGMGAAVGGIGVWLIIHGGSCVAVLSLFSASYFATKQNVNTWGHIEDTNSDIHRILGYTSVGLFAAMFIMGGLRCGRDVKGTAMRKATMTMHSLVGFAHYYINLGAIILSCLFAGSPAVVGCEKGTNVVLPGVSGIMIATLLWLLFDSVFHIILSVLLIMTDRREGIRRPWYCPIVPFLPPYANNDMRGSKIRKILFLVYVAVSFVFTVYMVSAINDVENDGKNGLHCTYETECKEVYGCSDLARGFADKRKKRLEALGITVDETSDYFRP